MESGKDFILMDFSADLAKLDKALALERLGGDEELLQEVATLFLEEYPVLLAEIRRGIDSQDAIQLERAAHSLKGSVANFGSDAAWQAAFELEKLGREKQLDGAESAYANLVVVMNGIEPELLQIASR